MIIVVVFLVLVISALIIWYYFDNRTLSKTDGVITVRLVSWSKANPIKLITHAALTCYQAIFPKFGKGKMDVEKRLFKTSHHTTHEHTVFSFDIENLSVADVTFGLHVDNPFYNTDQRSGRFCAEMFDNPDYQTAEKYVKKYWPGVSERKVDEIIDYFKMSMNLYKNNFSKAEALAKVFLKSERPKCGESGLKNAGKIAQEQMRMFALLMFPTALVYSIDLITLVSLWKSAWSPPMKAITDMMKDLVLDKYPELDFMFIEEDRINEDWSPEIKNYSGVLKEPVCTVKDISDINNRLVFPKPEEMHPVDLLYFHPKFMDNSVFHVLCEIIVSCATNGQDQRHRTLHRSEPKFSGHIYMPPILAEMGLEDKLQLTMERWYEVSHNLPPTLVSTIAPYGAMLIYMKDGDINAILHEAAKRGCWCAQEEIYHLFMALRTQLIKMGYLELASKLEPPCFKDGKCAEGSRCCGRDISLRNDPEKFFIKRKV